MMSEAFILARTNGFEEGKEEGCWVPGVEDCVGSRMFMYTQVVE